jgi:hypothetical protein
MSSTSCAETHIKMLVAMTLSEDLTISALHTVPSDWIVEAAPRDSGFAGRWESCKFDVPHQVIKVGVPALNSVLRQNASPLLLASAHRAGQQSAR